MNPTYEFHFFHPQRSATRTEALATLEALVQGGSVITRFRKSGQSVRVPANSVANPGDVIADDGKASVHLSKAALEYLLMIHAREDNGEIARFSVEEPYLENDASAVSVLLELAKMLNIYLPVWFAWGDHELNLDELESSLSLDRISALAWANLFGRDFIVRVGQSFLTQAPSHQTLVFKQGILLTLSPSPLVTPDSTLLSRVEKYFGIRAISRGK